MEENALPVALSISSVFLKAEDDGQESSSTIDRMMILYRDILKPNGRSGVHNTLDIDAMGAKQIEVNAYASYLELQYQLEASSSSLSSLQNISHTVRQFLNTVALPIIRSSRSDLDGLWKLLSHALSKLSSFPDPEVKLLLESATMGLLRDFEETCPRDEDMQGTRPLIWIAAYLQAHSSSASRDDDDVAVVNLSPLEIVRACLRIIRHHPNSEVRSKCVYCICPPLKNMLLLQRRALLMEGNEAPSLAADIWTYILDLGYGQSDAIDDKRNALAMLCLLFDGLNGPLALGDKEEFWEFLRIGLMNECEVIRERSLHLLQLQVDHAMKTASEDRDPHHDAQIRFWTNYVQVLDTFMKEHENHLLNQVHSIMIALIGEIFSQQNGSNSEQQLPYVQRILPRPSPSWAEVLMAHSFKIRNFSTHKKYLLWMVHEMPNWVVGQLTLEFILQHFLRACNNNICFRGDRGAFIKDLGHFLAIYMMNLPPIDESSLRRNFIRGLILYCRDLVDSSLVRQAVLGFVDNDDVYGPDPVPCLGEEELTLVRSLIAFLSTQFNQTIVATLMQSIVPIIQRFTDYRRLVIEGSNNVAKTLRSVLLELPLTITLGKEYDKVRQWVDGFSNEGKAGGVWWTEKTASGVRDFLLGQSADHYDEDDEGMDRHISDLGKSEASSLALACVFVHSSDDMQSVLAPLLDTLDRIHSHPYMPSERRVRSLILLRSFGRLIKNAKAGFVRSTLVPVMGETAEFVCGAISRLLHEPLQYSEQKENGGTGTASLRQFEVGPEAAATWKMYIGILSVIVWVAGDVRRVGNAILKLLRSCTTCLTTNTTSSTGTSDEVGPTKTRLRAITALKGILCNMASKRVLCSDLASELPALTTHVVDSVSYTKGSLSGHEFSTYLENVWRCRAHLYEIEAHQQVDKSLSSSRAEDMSQLLAALETASLRSVPNILFCMGYSIVPYLAAIGDRLEKRSRLKEIISTVWWPLEEQRYTLFICQLVIDMIFREELMSDPDFCEDVTNSPVHQLFNRLLDMGIETSRGFVLVNLAARCLQVWKKSPACSEYYADELVRLFILREPRENITGMPDEEPLEEDLAVGMDTPRGQLLSIPIIRLAALQFMSDLLKTNQNHLKPVLARLVISLLDLANETELKQTLLMSSPEYARKLCAWQALSVLVPFVEENLVPHINERLWSALTVLTLPPIRHSEEVFAAMLCRNFPKLCLPSLIRHLSDVEIRPQVSASLQCIAGWTCLAKDSPPLPDEFMQPLLIALIPWLCGTHAVTRVMSQLVVFHLLDRLFAMEENNRFTHCWDKAAFRGILDFLSRHREMVKLREKEIKIYQQQSVAFHCSVDGLVVMKDNGVGDLEPTHLLDGLKTVLTKLQKQFDVDDGIAVEGNEAMIEDDDAGVPQADTLTIQRKIVVSKILEAELAKEPEPNVNARGLPLQEIIVCASLVDKVPNLAGLARTCEIFAAKKLCIPSLRLMKDPQFEGISISAGQWITIEEVREKDTLSFLRRCRGEGYVVVGLEQTSTSQCITKTRLPEKMVLLLGKEKEGVPIELLAEVDCLIEIPQLGVCRSLNVHVSGALMIWEYTRQHMVEKISKAS